MVIPLKPDTRTAGLRGVQGPYSASSSQFRDFGALLVAVWSRNPRTQTVQVLRGTGLAVEILIGLWFILSGSATLLDFGVWAMGLDLLVAGSCT